MGIGEAAVTILSESGVPTPVVHTRLDPPRSRMGPTDDVDRSAKASPLYAKYGTRVDNQSAREMLAARMAPPPAAPAPDRARRRAAAPRRPDTKKSKAAAAAGGGVAAVGKFLTSRQGQAIEKQVVRGIFGMLKKSADAQRGFACARDGACGRRRGSARGPEARLSVPWPRLRPLE